MKLFPAIDILNGRAVRLLYGKRTEADDYGEPLDCAKRFADCGAEYLHVVNLSGAFGEENTFERYLEKIAKTGLVVQTGGGIRSLEEIESRFQAGASRVILGTVCVTRPDIFRAAVQKYGEKIVAGIDAKDGKLAVKGWTETMEKDAFVFGMEAKALGVEDAVFTDIRRDGALSGVNTEATVKMAETGLNVIASGGVRGMDDLYALKEKKIYGAVLGRSLYTGKIALREAIEEMRC